MTEEKPKNIFFISKYFETEEEYFEYVKEWGESHMDKEKFLKKWQELGHEIYQDGIHIRRL